MNNNPYIGKEIPCLDKGFVRLIDVMGDDTAIVQAARVSYGEGTKSYREDRSLIRYLMRHRHTSPFEMVEFKFHVKLPIFVARQWIRHRTANVNEYSGRYSVMKDEFFLPEADMLCTPASDNKQGRSSEQLPVDVANSIVTRMEAMQKQLFNEYEGLLELNLAREIARINLPLSSYTEWYWKIDLHNLFHFLNLRLDRHAQYEIRVYAEKMAEMIKPSVPLAYEAFEDYVLNALNFSSKELDFLKSIINVQNEITNEDLSKVGLKGGEAAEFREKLNKLTNKDQQE